MVNHFGIFLFGSKKKQQLFFCTLYPPQQKKMRNFIVPFLYKKKQNIQYYIINCDDLSKYDSVV